MCTFFSKSPFSKFSEAFSVYLSRREFPSLDPRKRNPSSQTHICKAKSGVMKGINASNELIPVKPWPKVTTSITHTWCQYTGCRLVKVKAPNTSHSIHNKSQHVSKLETTLIHAIHTKTPQFLKRWVKVFHLFIATPSSLSKKNHS